MCNLIYFISLTNPPSIDISHSLFLLNSEPKAYGLKYFGTNQVQANYIRRHEGKQKFKEKKKGSQNF
jgi:hypothetical protein